MNQTNNSKGRQPCGTSSSKTKSGQSVLTPEHRAKIRSSALSYDQAEALGWISDGSDGSLVIPYLKPDGSPELCHDGKPFSRRRLSDEKVAERKSTGEKKPPKYLSPKGEGCRLYHSHLAIQAGDYEKRLKDRFTPLRITEGELKTEAANAHDPERLTIGIGGVNSWKDRYDGQSKEQGSKPLVDWEEITLEGREVRLCFDSDLNKPQVAAALEELSFFLLDKGARVLIEVLPHGLDGERLGLDDLIHRHGAKVFRRIASIAKTPFKKRAKEAKGKPEFEWNFDPEPTTTHERNVYLSGLLGDKWRWSTDGKDQWQRWTGTHWTAVEGDDEAFEALEGFAELQGWDNRELPAFRSLLAALRRSVEQANDAGSRGLIPFRNGCLVLDDMRLVPHDPKHGNTWALSYDYSPGASCPSIEAFVKDRLGDVASVELFRAFARSLLTEERTKCFLEITGPGDTGKSALANLLVALVGNQNTAAGKLHRLENPELRFETIKLRGKRLAIFSECQDYSGQLQNLKLITGDDPVPGELKRGKHVDFFYKGGVVLVGNGPIRASDPTGAVLNRRRSLHVDQVVRPSDQRPMLDPDGKGGWIGELAGELAGLVNWALTMSPADARKALARDVKSPARAEAELETLLATDLLADWADQFLVWDDGGGQVLFDGKPSFPMLRVGMVDSGQGEDGGDRFLFPSYLHFVEQNGRNTKPLALRTFKAKLVDLLRDTLGLPMPAGCVNSGSYKVRLLGSVVPCLRWRGGFDDAEGVEGVIRHAFMQRARAEEPSGNGKTDARNGKTEIRNGKNPVGNGCNGCNGSEPVDHKVENDDPDPDPGFPLSGNGSVGSVTSITSVTQKGFAVTDPLRDPLFTVTGEPSNVVQLRPGGRPVLVDGKPGWHLPGAMPKGKGGSVHVLVTNPRGKSENVERRRITLPEAAS